MVLNSTDPISLECLLYHGYLVHRIEHILYVVKIVRTTYCDYPITPTMTRLSSEWCRRVSTGCGVLDHKLALRGRPAEPLAVLKFDVIESVAVDVFQIQFRHAGI